MFWQLFQADWKPESPEMVQTQETGSRARTVMLSHRNLLLILLLRLRQLLQFRLRGNDQERIEKQEES
ncbi:hypothetical protein Leryth_025829 [Lithospermum erythrorhizon]|nr:hypothetical protein Leryth_025829 [Lithospermum erythrorhizon]